MVCTHVVDTLRLPLRNRLKYFCSEDTGRAQVIQTLSCVPNVCEFMYYFGLSNSNTLNYSYCHPQRYTSNGSCGKGMFSQVSVC